MWHVPLQPEWPHPTAGRTVRAEILLLTLLYMRLIALNAAASAEQTAIVVTVPATYTCKSTCHQTTVSNRSFTWHQQAPNNATRSSCLTLLMLKMANSGH